MKIHFDKVDSLPKHSLSIRSIKEALAILPPSMTSSFNYVHVSNQLPHKSRFDRPVILSEVSRRLTICDRGIAEHKVIEHIYLELAQRSPDTPQHLSSRYANRLDPHQHRQLLEIITPYLEAFRNRLA